jgi:hypothetical protein
VEFAALIPPYGHAPMVTVPGPDELRDIRMGLRKAAVERSKSQAGAQPSSLRTSSSVTGRSQSKTGIPLRTVGAGPARAVGRRINSLTACPSEIPRWRAADLATAKAWSESRIVVRMPTSS